MVTGFIQLDGVTVGAVANRTAIYDENGEKAEEFAAVLTTDGAYKAAEFRNISVTHLKYQCFRLLMLRALKLM